MPDKKLFIVEDEAVLRQSLSLNFKKQGVDVETFGTGEKALAKMDDASPMVVLLDLRLPEMNGIEVLKKIREINQDALVIIMTAYGDTQTTVDAVKCGAYNFINKPFELEEMERLIFQAFENLDLKREVNYLRYRQKKLEKYCDLVGKSPAMQEVYRQIDMIAETKDTTVLIRGESGTGKELAAGAIHYKSSRHRQAFMEINCSSLPETLLESELFGHEKGAFTDAATMQKGQFEMADKGTIFLDEIGELPLSIQVKLLGFLEKKKFKRLGCGKDIKVDVRIVAATNRDLETAIQLGNFREDLYHRLNVVTLTLPPLRERMEDIVVLADYFLDQLCREMGKKRMYLASDVTDILSRYDWPGNVRALRNFIERTVIFGRKEILGREILGPEFTQPGCSEKEGRSKDQLSLDNNLSGENLDGKLAQTEKQLIEQALQRTKNNKTKAAELLGISRFALNRRLKRLEAKG
ncbi:MAG: sigma-54 dependent transcriptional regulator [Thermodesulfobacteriota bacterium]|nr:sigma-54 dependent transcriptional regulator [Thermodesulfobacteriota bacterium]